MPESLKEFDHLWDYQNPEQTEEKFAELLPEVRESGDLDTLGQLLTQLARTRGLQRRFDEAHETLDEVESMFPGERFDPALSRTRVRYLLERGRVFNSSGDPQGARPLFLEAWEFARVVGEDFHAVDAAHMMAIIEPAKQQLEWNTKAKALAEGSQDERARGWLGALYNNIGWTFHGQGQFTDALEVFEAGLKFREERGQERPILIARWCIGRTLRSLDRIDEALKMQETLLEEWSKAGDESGYVHEELGECLRASGRGDEATPHFRKAHEILCKDEWLSDEEPERLARLAELGAQ